MSEQHLHSGASNAGTGGVHTSPPSSREREAARLTPALYHLIPSFKASLVTDPGFGNNLFDPGLWQPLITETLMEYVRNPPSLRQVEDILFERDIDICHETVRFV